MNDDFDFEKKKETKPEDEDRDKESSNLIGIKTRGNSKKLQREKNEIAKKWQGIYRLIRTYNRFSDEMFDNFYYRFFSKYVRQ